MTSEVKGWEQLLYVRILFFPLLSRKSRRQADTTGAPAALRGWGPPCLASVGCLAPARDARTLRPQNAAEGATPPGLRLCRDRGAPSHGCVTTPPAFGLRCPGHRRGHGPPAGPACAGHGDDARGGLCAWGPARVLPRTAPDLGLPTPGVERGGALCQAPWQGTAALRRRPRGPGPVDAGPTGRGRPRRGPPPCGRRPPPGTMRRASAPEQASAVAGAPRGSGLPGPPRWAPRRAPGHRAGPGGPRPPARSARVCPARGARGPDAPDVPAGQGQSGRLPARRLAAPGWAPHPRGALAGERDARGPDRERGARAAARRR